MESQNQVQRISTEASEEVSYPTGITSEDGDAATVEVGLKIEPSKPTSFFFVSKNFESLEYQILSNKLQLEKEKSLSFRSKTKTNFLRIVYFLITGVLTAFVGIYVEVGMQKLGHWKFHYLSDVISRHHSGPVEEVALMCALWYLGVIVPVMIGSSLVVFLAPYAAGGGVAQCIGYLNGIRVTNVLNIKGFLVKINSVVCTVISGIAGGKEGPMMHMGAIVGGSLPSFLPWQTFKADRERRDLAAAGFGAGIAVAFGAPIGGLLLSLEEGVSFWNVKLMWKSFLGIQMAYLVMLTFLSIIEGVPGSLNNQGLLTFGKISDNVTNYEYFELLMFAAEGLIGGLLGASFVKIHTYFTCIRRRRITTKTRKLIEALLLALVTATFSFLVIMLLKTCSENSEESDSSSHPKKRIHYQLYCSNGWFSDASVVFMQTQNGIIHSMFSSDEINWLMLLVFCVFYYVLFNLTLGVSISAGLFVPMVLFGSAWGRLFGILVQNLSSHASWATPAKYAYVGATAQLSGTVGKTFSILVIMVEASGSISFSIPLMVVVTITKYVETFFVMPIYETQMHQMGLPFLPSQPPPLSSDVLTSNVMSTPPLVTLPINPTVQNVLHTLQTTTHNAFPINSKHQAVRGLILRQQLLVLLKFKAYKYPSPTTSKHMCQCYDLYFKYARKHIKLDTLDVDTKHYSTTLDLMPYYNPYPYTVNQLMPLSSTYFLFRSLGLRHIIVVDESFEPVAMVTRKDLAKFHTWEQFGRMGIKEMIIK